MGVNLDRRAFMAAASISTIVIAAPAMASSEPISPAGNRPWDRSMAAHRQAKAEDAAFDPRYWEIHEAWEAGKPSMDAIHWKEFAFSDRANVARMIDLEKEWQRFLDGEGRWWNARNPGARKAKFRAALDSVQAFRDAEAKNDRDTGMDKADDRWNALAEAVAETRRVLMQMPAPDMAALSWKLAELRDEDGGLVPWELDYVRQTFADIDRLMPAGA